MKYFFTIMLWFGVGGIGWAQSVGIGTGTPDTTAQLDISSSSRGLLMPRMPWGSIYTMKNPGKGLMVFDSTNNRLVVNMGTSTQPLWESVDNNSSWQLGGNTGGIGRGFGTYDKSPVYMVLGGQVAGILDPLDTTLTAHTIAIGEGSMLQGGMDDEGTTGKYSVALGYQAMQYGGNYSVGIGYDALYGGGGNFDVGIGHNAMSGANGQYCVGLGYDALFATTGNYCVGIGDYAFGGSQGNNNIGIGHDVGFNTQAGHDNVAIGGNSFYNNASGLGNVAIGSSSLTNTTNSWYNTVVGYNSGMAYDNGYNNVFVGANNDVNGAGYYNVIAIGQEVICTGSSQARFGNSATSSIGGYADWTNFSDGRYKKNMKEEVKGLDFIMRLRPVTYNLDVRGIRAHLGQGAPKDAGTQRSIAAREQEVLSGFSAQEVEQAAAAAGYDFSGVDKPKNANDFYGLRYGDFVVPLVKAVQEQQQLIKELQQEIVDLKKQIQH
jgi:hypothetical protein